MAPQGRGHCKKDDGRAFQHPNLSTVLISFLDRRENALLGDAEMGVDDTDRLATSRSVL